ncbi:hypothetical protein STCU_10544 [Strigomonas culicis]|uniref:Uncharacterized protein n=1 Tax=Strigomonas culicis TaxID=28005 RepID=S9THM2_9TRYP|nr:hypothetical protein STCU_10544 [Strigomonas culicis]|eukprot:EPY17537.1 hypothetical protein STCU_10544 [Strigomonas culicis]
MHDGAHKEGLAAAVEAGEGDDVRVREVHPSEDVAHPPLLLRPRDVETVVRVVHRRRPRLHDGLHGQRELVAALLLPVRAQIRREDVADDEHAGHAADGALVLGDEVTQVAVLHPLALEEAQDVAIVTFVLRLLDHLYADLFADEAQRVEVALLQQVQVLLAPPVEIERERHCLAVAPVRHDVTQPLHDLRKEDIVVKHLGLLAAVEDVVRAHRQLHLAIVHQHAVRRIAIHADDDALRREALLYTGAVEHTHPRADRQRNRRSHQVDYLLLLSVGCVGAAALLRRQRDDLRAAVAVQRRQLKPHAIVALRAVLLRAVGRVLAENGADRDRHIVHDAPHAVLLHRHEQSAEVTPPLGRRRGCGRGGRGSAGGERRRRIQPGHTAGEEPEAQRSAEHGRPPLFSFSYFSFFF